MQEALVRKGFECLSTTSPDRAKELLEHESFDVLVADVKMPELSGLDLLACVRRIDPRCEVLLITGFANRERIAQALLLGAYDYLEKPLDMAEFVAVVSKAAATSGGVPELHTKAAAALELNGQTAQAALDSVQALSRAVEAKDPYTRRHSEQVAHYAAHLARSLQLPEGEVESIHIAALLHDIGKIGVPDEILTKPGQLSDEEFGHIRQHPGLGEAILEKVTLFRKEAKLIRYHHERWDGRGYPDGLAAEEIPLLSQVLNVADSVDAMLMARTYKHAYPVEQMLDELVQEAGGQFSPRLSAAAIDWCNANPGLLITPAKPVEAVA